MVGGSASVISSGDDMVGVAVDGTLRNNRASILEGGRWSRGDAGGKTR